MVNVVTLASLAAAMNPQQAHRVAATTQRAARKGCNFFMDLLLLVDTLPSTRPGRIKRHTDLLRQSIFWMTLIAIRDTLRRRISSHAPESFTVARFRCGSSMEQPH